MNKPRIMVMGHGRHGKDTVCDMLADIYGFKHISSSLFAADKIIMPAIGDMWRKYSGASPVPVDTPAVPLYMNSEDCFADRHNHRKFWYDSIVEFERTDPTALGRAIFEEFDIYCGIRNKRSFHALKNCGLFDVSIWVDRSDHLPPEDTTSNSIEQWMADYTIDNNGSLEDLEKEVRRIIDYIVPYVCTAEDIVALRNKTSAGLLDCKKALRFSNGDVELAAEWLRLRGTNSFEPFMNAQRTGTVTGRFKS